VKAALEPQRDSLDFSELESTAMPFDQFCGLMRRLLGDASPPFTNHDIVTLARYYQHRADTALSLNELLAICHDQLKRANFEGLEHIDYQCQHHDGTRFIGVAIFRDAALRCCSAFL